MCKCVKCERKEMSYYSLTVLHVSVKRVLFHRRERLKKIASLPSLSSSSHLLPPVIVAIDAVPVVVHLSPDLSRHAVHVTSPPRCVAAPLQCRPAATRERPGILLRHRSKTVLEVNVTV